LTRQVTDVIVAVTVMSSAVYRNMLLKANLAKSTNTVSMLVSGQVKNTMNRSENTMKYKDSKIQ